MPDPIPGCDPSEAYEVVLLDPIRNDRDPHGWWACLCNGIVVRIASQRAPLARYASEPEYRASTTLADCRFAAFFRIPESIFQ
jgi:hypothetical protein